MLRTKIFTALMIGFVVAPAMAAPIAAPPADSLSKRGPDPAPTPAPLALEEVFVTSKTPRKKNEAATVKEAFAKVKNGGVIFITEMSSDISNDDTALFIDRPVTIALDPDLKTAMDVTGDGVTARAKLNGAADGACMVVGQYELGSTEGRRQPRNEVTLRSVELAPSPGSSPGACVTINDGRVFFDNVAIAASAGKAFFKGVVVRGGELITNERVRITASKIGVEARGGDVEIAEGATISAAAPPSGASLMATCADAAQTASVGVLAGRSSDNRVGDPAVVLRNATVSGFDYGVCAAGGGVSIERGRIAGNEVGVRAERRIRITDANMGDAKAAALIVRSSDADISTSTLYNSGVGVFLDTELLPTFRSNRFHFNGVAIRYDQPISRRRSLIDKLFNRYSEAEKATVAAFTDNIISCNKTAGVFEKYKLFRKAHRNQCERNSPGQCSGSDPDGVCAALRRELNLSNSSCAGN